MALGAAIIQFHLQFHIHLVIIDLCATKENTGCCESMVVGRQGPHTSQNTVEEEGGDTVVSLPAHRLPATHLSPGKRPGLEPSWHLSFLNEPILLTPCFQTPSPQNRDTVSICCVAFQSALAN